MSTHILEQRYYFDKPGWMDGTSEYHEILRRYSLSTEAVVLEIGSGPENRSSKYVASRVAHLDGLDIDKRVLDNSALREAYVYDGRKFPKQIADESYDLVVADYVMEHVEHPSLMLAEIHRVLRSGGHFVFRTPNIYHYVSLISRFTPHSFHLAMANKARQTDDDAVDPYPTFYRFNSRCAVRTVAREAGMREVELTMVEKQPNYLKFNSMAYRCGVAYERAVNSTRVLSVFRANIFAVLCKG
ncbi:class I SAM-dependent methyltransferase [Granulosicoccus sp.]|nr:class I SAM-dependent methyltransferase [Granulosicoccus sp.]MDB4222428.1 class I SAM-dependent methyltransferase [Granulosicoccus sp.]